jgi:hypothetical protein
MRDPETDTSKGLLEPLLAAARPELYRANAFRILGLPVDASERSIKRQAERVQLIEKFGGAGALRAVGPLPLNPDPSVDDIREAIHRLHSPERRLFDEFFWFWPAQSGDGNADPALAALAQHDLKAATQIWYAQAEADEHGLATHNVAVLYHAAALDLEYIPEVKPLSANLRKLQSAYWLEAFARWRMVLKDERFWRRLDTRIGELNDPRLTPETARELRKALPLLLLLVNAHLAVRAIGEGDNDEAERQKQLMHQSGFDEETIEGALRRASEHVVERVRTMCVASEPEAEADPPRAGEVTRRLLEGSGALIDEVENLLSEDDRLADELRDEVAACALNCLVTFGQDSGAWRAALELLERARPFAISSGVRERMDDLRAHLLRFAYQPEKVKVSGLETL